MSALRAFAPPMYTRLLKPSAPPPVVAVAGAPAATPRPRVAVRAITPASAPRPVHRKKKPLPPPEAQVATPAEPVPQIPPDSEQVAQAPQAAASDAQPPASSPEPAASASEAAASAPQAVASASTPAASASPAASAAAAPASAPPGAAAPAQSVASAAAPLDRWPVDTRLNYRLSGQWRTGPLFGDAHVQWQRQGSKYQVRLDVKIQMLGTQVLTSQGDVTPDGLLPRAYEETRPGKRRVANMGDDVVTLENGTTVKRPPGVQDTASQFVELSHRFATGKEVLAVGRSVSVWLARPGGVDQWTYDIVGRELVRTRMGDVEAFHLKPRPLAEPHGNITAEMWFAPSLEYLPVRIRVVVGTEAFVDLVADQIEQR
jgi:hypothetical protein